MSIKDVKWHSEKFVLQKCIIAYHNMFVYGGVYTSTLMLQPPLSNVKLADLCVEAAFSLQCLAQHLWILKWVQRLMNKQMLRLCISLWKITFISPDCMLFFSSTPSSMIVSRSQRYWKALKVLFLLLIFLTVGIDAHSKVMPTIWAKRWHSNSNNNGLWPDLKAERARHKYEALE